MKGQKVEACISSWQTHDHPFINHSSNTVPTELTVKVLHTLKNTEFYTLVLPLHTFFVDCMLWKKDNFFFVMSSPALRGMRKDHFCFCPFIGTSQYLFWRVFNNDKKILSLLQAGQVSSLSSIRCHYRHLWSSCSSSRKLQPAHIFPVLLWLHLLNSAQT